MTDIVSSDLTGILLQYGDDTPINITALQVQEGDNAPVAVWAEEYILSITKTNPGYIKSAIVNRTASQYGHGATGELSNGATLYYGDTLTAAATAADTTTSYTEWVPSYISKPTFTNKTDTSVQVNNSNAFAVTLYYKVSGTSSYSSVAIAANSNTTLSGLTAGSEYVFYFTASKSRTKTVTTYSVTKSWASLTVDSNESITFTGSASPVESTETGTLTSSTQSYVMPYKITLTKNNNVSSISLVFYPFNDHAQTEVTAAGTYYGKANTPYSWTATAATEYNISSGSGSGTLSSAVTIAPTASRKTFSITFAKTGTSDSAWNSSTAITAEYGDYIQRSGSTVTVYKWDATSTARATRTFNNGTNAAYTYGTATYTNAPTTKTQLNRSSTYAVSAAQDWARKTFTITFALGGSNYGSWSKSSITAQYGDTISRSGDVVTIYKWDATSTARDSSTFANGSATGYTYSVSYNTPTSPITAAQTMTATTSRTANDYNITITKNTGISTIYYKVNGASSWTSTTASTTVSAKYASTVYWYAKAATEYNGNNVGSSSSPNSFTMSTSGTIAPTATRKSFSVTIALTKGTGDSASAWDSTTSITAYYGDYIQRSGNVVTIYKWDATTTARATRTLTVATGYNASYTNATTTKTQLNRSSTLAVSATTARKSFTITFAKAGTSSGSWSSATITAQYGDTMSRSGNVVTIKKWDDSSANRGTSTFTPTTGYNVSYNSISSPITAAQTITATTSVKSFTYLTGTLPTGVASITCTRSSSPYKGASTGTVANNETIYYGDKLYFTATASSGYNAPSVPNYYDSSHTLTVSSNVQGKDYVTAGSAASWNTVWTGSQALKVGTDPSDPSMAYGDTTISGLSHIITSSTPLQVKVTTRYGNSGWVSASNEPVKFSESRKSGSRTRYCESSVWAPDYASSTSVTITARFDDQSSGLLLFPSITAIEIQAYY